MACETQFKYTLFGDPIALNYPAMYAVAGSLEIEVDQVVFRKIRILEQAVIAGETDSGPPAGGGKACRHPAACAMCQKECAERLTQE